MKLKFVVALVGLACASVPAFAAEDTPTAAATADSAASAIEAQLNGLVEKIKAKMQTGARTEEALTEELKAFDALLAEHRGNKSDAVAKIAMMRAALYVEVFENYDKGGELLTEIQKDFAGTQAAQFAGAMVQRLESMKEKQKLQAALKPGVVFPDFDEKDLNGEPLSIAKYKGKIVLVDFWATWCGPCVAELPNVSQAYEKYHAKGFEIVGISLDQSEDKLKSFLADKKMTWPQYFDGKGWGNKLGQKYGVDSIPATYLLDRDGKIVAKDLRGPALEQELERLLAK